MTRSELMSRIRSKWTLPERKVHGFLKSRHVRHRMHPRMAGNPDALVGDDVVLFVDGCFWHGHAAHYRAPKTNAGFWRRKVESNAARDRKNTTALRRAGWRVIRVWECELPALLGNGGLLEKIGAR